MANTSSRTLRLLTLLQSHRYWAGRELAERLGVSARTLRRDIDRLRELGYPVTAVRGVDGGYHLAAGASLPPLAVDDEEAVALALGLRAAAQGGVAGLEDAAIRALTKILQIMPTRLRMRVNTLESVTVPGRAPGWGPAVDATTLTDVAQACRDEERLRFGYVSAGGTRSDRHVEPHRLVPMGRRWYLVAYDLARNDWRTFRLDRIDDAATTGTRFRPRTLPADDAAAFVQAGIDGLSDAPHAVRVRIASDAATVQAVVQRWGTVEALEEHTSMLHMTVDDLSWVAMVLGAVPAEFEVVEPRALVDLLADWGARFTRATTDRY